MGTPGDLPRGLEGGGHGPSAGDAAPLLDVGGGFAGGGHDDGAVAAAGDDQRGGAGAELDQVTLVERSGVSANTIRSMEGKGANVLTSGRDTVRTVQSAFEPARVEFLNHRRPGVWLRGDA